MANYGVLLTSEKLAAKVSLARLLLLRMRLSPSLEPLTSWVKARAQTTQLIKQRIDLSKRIKEIKIIKVIREFVELSGIRLIDPRNQINKARHLNLIMKIYSSSRQKTSQNLSICSFIKKLKCFKIIRPIFLKHPL